MTIRMLTASGISTIPTIMILSGIIHSRLDGITPTTILGAIHTHLSTDGTRFTGIPGIPGVITTLGVGDIAAGIHLTTATGIHHTIITTTTGITIGNPMILT